jgi:hypothetical protein
MKTGILYTIKVANRHYLTGYYIGDTTAPIPTQSFHDADHVYGSAIWWSDKPCRQPGSKKCEKILLKDIQDVFMLVLIDREVFDNYDDEENR